MPPPPADVTATVSARGSDTRAFAYPHRPAPADLDAPPPLPAVGTRLGPFALQQRLGEGASSVVYRGWDKAGSRPVVLKVLNWAAVADRDAALAQLRREAAALSRVNHPRVVRFVDLGFDPRHPYLATEFFEGRPLGELLRGGGPLPPAWALHLIGDVADALGAVWRAGLVHRDVKPDNVLVGPNGTGMLIDFGLAKVVGSPSDGPELAGTAAYMAPEQAKDSGGVDHRADVYALGVTLYEALTGRLPFEGRTRAAVMVQHLSRAPEPPCSRAGGIPSWASDLCLWMMAKDPADRPQDLAELQQALDLVTGRVG